MVVNVIDRPRPAPTEALMPHLHLPAAHSDTDLALAVDVAAAVGSRDLYVAWSHAEGPGLAPEIEALVCEERPPAGLTGMWAALAEGLAALWALFVRGPVPDAADAAPRKRAAARARAAGEPSA
jgi:hypothetical protein